jgi:hypothetical protein
LAISEIRLFMSLATVWPASSSSSGSSLSSSEELGSAALPLVNLALLLLEASAGRVGYVLEVIDFVTFLCDSLLPDLHHSGAATAAGPAAVGSSSSSSNVPRSPVVQQLLQSAQLPKLLAETQALHVLVLRHITSSQAGDRHQEHGVPTSSSSSGSRASTSQTLESSSSSSGGSSSSVPSSGGVQQGAEHLLVANMPSWDVEAFARLVEYQGFISSHWQRKHEDGHTAAALLSTAAVLQHMLPCWAAARADTGSSSSASSSSSSVASTPAQPARQRHPQCLPLLVLVAQLRHWALVQVQLMQLVDSVGCKAMSMNTLLVMLHAADAVGTRLHTAVQKALLQPVLQQLLPHVQGVLGSQEATAASSSSINADVLQDAAPSSSSSSSGTAGCSMGTITAAGSSSSSNSTCVALNLGLSTLLLKLAQGGGACWH